MPTPLSTPFFSKFALSCLAVLLCGLGSTAWAADPPEDPLLELERKANAAYEAGQYQKAIDLMLDAYAQDAHPSYSLNIAVSFGKLNNCAEAKRWAERALTAPDAKGNPLLPPEALEIAQGVIDDCKGVVVLPPDDGTNNGTGKGNGNGTGNGNTQPPMEDTTWRLYTGGGLMVSGLILTGASMAWFFDIDAREDELLLDNDRGVIKDEATFNIRRDDLLNLRKWPYILGITGGAMALAGGALFFYEVFTTTSSETPPQTGQTWKVAPLLGPDTQGASLEITF